MTLFRVCAPVNPALIWQHCLSSGEAYEGECVPTQSCFFRPRSLLAEQCEYVTRGIYN